MAVELETMQTARMTLARSPPGTTVGGWWLIPHLKPVGHQSTNWMVLLVLMVATAALTSLGTTSPLYMRQHAMYFPWRGSHLAIMEAGVGHQVGLELSHIDVQSTIESEGGSEGGDDLGDESVQVGVGGSLDVEVTTADIVDGFVVEHDGDIGVLKERVSGEHGVVRLNDSGGDLGRGVHSETELGFLAVVNGESLEEERAETGAGTTTDGVEDEEALETSALIGELSDTVEAEINNLLTDG